MATARRPLPSVVISPEQSGTTREELEARRVSSAAAGFLILELESFMAITMNHERKSAKRSLSAGGKGWDLSVAVPIVEECQRLLSSVECNGVVKVGKKGGQILESAPSARRRPWRRHAPCETLNGRYKNLGNSKALGHAVWARDGGSVSPALGTQPSSTPVPCDEPTPRWRRTPEAPDRLRLAQMPQEPWA